MDESSACEYEHPGKAPLARWRWITPSGRNVLLCHTHTRGRPRRFGTLIPLGDEPPLSGSGVPSVPRPPKPPACAAAVVEESHAYR